MDDDKFRELYQYVIAAVGEELFFEEQTAEPIASVRFRYTDEYAKVGGREEDVIEFYKSDDRKSIVSVNGTVLFKVRELYTDRLRENVTALIDGGEIKIDW